MQAATALPVIPERRQVELARSATAMDQGLLQL